MTSRRVINRRFPGVGVTRFAVRVLAKLWLVATVALVAMVGVVHFDLTSEDYLGPLATTSEVAAGSSGNFAIPATEFDSYRKVRYAGTDIAVVDSRIVPNNESRRPIVVVEFAVRNGSPFQSRLPVNMINLVGVGGKVTPLDRFEYTDFPLRLVVDPGQTASGLAVFKLPRSSSTDLADYELHIGENGRWPAILPLVGDLAPVPFPQPLELTFAEDQLRFRDFTVELSRAVSALEYGVYRAPVGQHLGVITLTVTGSPSSSFGTIERELWTLIDEQGVEARAIRALPGQREADANSVTMELVFGYSTEASELTLTVGRPDGRQTVAEFEVQSFE